MPRSRRQTCCTEKCKYSYEHELTEPTLSGFNIVMMSKPDQTGFSEKRLRPRTKLAKMLHVRQSAVENDFSELVISKNVSKDGIYFHTHRSDYRKGMRLLVTFPFTLPAKTPPHISTSPPFLSRSLCAPTRKWRAHSSPQAHTARRFEFSSLSCTDFGSES